MGQNKAMACKSLIKKKAQVFFLLVLFINLNTVKVFALDSQYLYFSPTTTENNLGYVSGMIPSLSISMTSGTASCYFDIYDSSGNLLKTGFYQGDLPTDSSKYPLKIVSVVTASTGNADSWSVRATVSYSEVSTDSSFDLSGVEDLLSQIDDDMLDKLDQLKEKLQDIVNYIGAINDYLSNPAYLNAGMEDLNNSIDNLTSKNPVSDMSSTQSSLSNLSGGSSSSGGFEIPLEIGGQTFNALDFSALSGQLQTIRELMNAIIWIEFAVFCIRIVVPKFKV